MRHLASFFFGVAALAMIGALMPGCAMEIVLDEPVARVYVAPDMIYYDYAAYRYPYYYFYGGPAVVHRHYYDHHPQHYQWDSRYQRNGFPENIRLSERLMRRQAPQNQRETHRNTQRAPTRRTR